MDKAYDMKGLSEEMKAKGLDLAEDAALVAYEALAEWLKKSAVLSKTPYDDMLAVVLPAIDGFVKDQIDRIDGKDDI